MNKQKAIHSSDKEAVSPPGWSGTVKEMKKHKDIDNPWALAWWMSKRKPGDSWGAGGKLKKKPKPHHKPEKKKSKKKKSYTIDYEKIVKNVVKESL